MITTAELFDKRVLVVEDEFMIALDLAGYLRQAGARVVGLASTVSAALDELERAEPDGVILDINLRGDMAFPVADLLIARGIPFVFLTGYDAEVVPHRFAAVTRCQKPMSASDVTSALFRWSARS